MQTFSLASLVWLAQVPAKAPVPSAKALLLDAWGRIAPDWPLFILAMVILLAGSLFGLWLASKPLTEDDDGNLASATEVWGIYVFFGAILFAVGAVLLPKTLFAYQAAGGRVESIGGLALAIGLFSLVGIVFVFALFAAPMRVYRFTFGTAAIFLVIALIINGAFTFAVRLVFSAPRARISQNFTGWPAKSVSLADLPDKAARARGKAFDLSERRALDKTKTPQERQQALKDLYGQLETFRVTLHASNPKGLTEYERRKARYEQILSDLRAEVAAQKAAAN